MTDNKRFIIPDGPQPGAPEPIQDFDSTILSMLEKDKLLLGDDYHSFDTYFSGYLACLEDFTDPRETTEAEQHQTARTAHSKAFEDWKYQYKKFQL